MKNHIFTIILLILAVVSFTFRFFVSECWQNYCDIAAFVLPTLAAVVEIVLSERNGKKMKEELKKRAVWQSLPQEEYDKLKAEGKIDDNVYYATYEE